MVIFFVLWFLPPLFFFSLCPFSNSPICVQLLKGWFLYSPSAHKHAHVGPVTRAMMWRMTSCPDCVVQWVAFWQGSWDGGVGWLCSLHLFASVSLSLAFPFPVSLRGSQHWLVQCALCSLGKRLIIQHAASIKFKFGSSSNLLAWHIYY